MAETAQRKSQDRFAGRVRHQVHQHLYGQITGGLTRDDIGRLEGLLSVRNGRTAFSRIKAVPRGSALQHMRQWSHRLDWLESVVTTSPLVAGIARTKVQQFAAEALALDVADMRRLQIVPRRRALLVCMLHQAQIHTRDQLAEMFHIPPHYVVECVAAQRKPPDVRICRLRNQSRVGTVPPSTSTPHWPAWMARR